MQTKNWSMQPNFLKKMIIKEEAASRILEAASVEVASRFELLYKVLQTSA